LIDNYLADANNHIGGLGAIINSNGYRAGLDILVGRGLVTLKNWKGAWQIFPTVAGAQLMKKNLYGYLAPEPVQPPSIPERIPRVNMIIEEVLRDLEQKPSPRLERALQKVDDLLKNGDAQSKAEFFQCVRFLKSGSAIDVQMGKIKLRKLFLDESGDEYDEAFYEALFRVIDDLENTSSADSMLTDIREKAIYLKNKLQRAKKRLRMIRGTSRLLSFFSLPDERKKSANLLNQITALLIKLETYVKLSTYSNIPEDAEEDLKAAEELLNEIEMTFPEQDD